MEGEGGGQDKALKGGQGQAHRGGRCQGDSTDMSRSKLWLRQTLGAVGALGNVTSLGGARPWSHANRCDDT